MGPLVTLRRRATALANIEASSPFPWLLGTALYLLYFGHLLLLGDARFWDDWDFYSPFGLGGRRALDQNGSPPWRAFIEFDVLSANPRAFPVAALLSFFVGAIALARIVASLRVLPVRHTRLISLLFLVAPLASARVAMVNTFWVVSLAVFLVGWMLLTSTTLSTRCLGLVLILAASSARPFLPLSIVVSAHLWVLARRRGDDRHEQWGGWGIGLSTGIAVVTRRRDLRPWFGAALPILALAASATGLLIRMVLFAA